VPRPLSPFSEFANAFDPNGEAVMMDVDISDWRAVFCVIEGFEVGKRYSFEDVSGVSGDPVNTDVNANNEDNDGENSREVSSIAMSVTSTAVDMSVDGQDGAGAGDGIGFLGNETETETDMSHDGQHVAPSEADKNFPPPSAGVDESGSEFSVVESSDDDSEVQFIGIRRAGESNTDRPLPSRETPRDLSRLRALAAVADGFRNNPTPADISRRPTADEPAAASASALVAAVPAASASIPVAAVPAASASIPVAAVPAASAPAVPAAAPVADEPAASASAPVAAEDSPLAENSMLVSRCSTPVNNYPKKSPACLHLRRELSLRAAESRLKYHGDDEGDDDSESPRAVNQLLLVREQSNECFYDIVSESATVSEVAVNNEAASAVSEAVINEVAASSSAVNNEVAASVDLNNEAAASVDINNEAAASAAVNNEVAASAAVNNEAAPIAVQPQQPPHRVILGEQVESNHAYLTAPENLMHNEEDDICQCCLRPVSELIDPVLPENCHHLMCHDCLCTLIRTETAAGRRSMICCGICRRRMMYVRHAYALRLLLPLEELAPLSRRQIFREFMRNGFHNVPVFYAQPPRVHIRYDVLAAVITQLPYLMELPPETVIVDLCGLFDLPQFLRDRFGFYNVISLDHFRDNGELLPVHDIANRFNVQLFICIPAPDTSNPRHSGMLNHLYECGIPFILLCGQILLTTRRDSELFSRMPFETAMVIPYIGFIDTASRTRRKRNLHNHLFVLGYMGHVGHEGSHWTRMISWDAEGLDAGAPAAAAAAIDVTEDEHA
jgi:hypothetical protein